MHLKCMEFMNEIYEFLRFFAIIGKIMEERNFFGSGEPKAKKLNNA